ncbi:hypothetical protein ACFL0Z_02370 [Patescibacteria group bacterium]
MADSIASFIGRFHLNERGNQFQLGKDGEISKEIRCKQSQLGFTPRKVTLDFHGKKAFTGDFLGFFEENRKISLYLNRKNPTPCRFDGLKGLRGEEIKLKITWES